LGRLAAIAGVLCWVLRHEHNDQFAVMLAAIEDATKAAGYTLDKQT